ncbi:Na+/glutamate symporter [Catenulispora sp. GAS73]|uniref:hypothetical protein n=1 Tax=Catenulispora sp. GAS73 TaxID=3156269 RepID=UPI003513B968
MEFFKRLRRAFRAAKAPIYTDLGTTVAQAASTTSIAAGISGGAPLAKEKKQKKAKQKQETEQG